MAEPNAPFSVTPLATCETTVSASKRTVTITTLTQLLAYLAGTSFGGVLYGDDVSLALTDYDARLYGDELQLPVPGGVQTGNDYVTFRSANLSVLPPAGTTVTRADQANMPRCIGPNSMRGFFRVANAVDHYRFQGLRFYGDGCFGGLFFQSPNTNTSLASQPHHFIVDRCIIDFNPATGNFGGQGVQMTGRHMAVINCAFYEIYNPAGGEPHAILVPGGQGPYLIHQNEIQIVGAAIFAGDNQLANPGIVPSDITVTENYVHVPVEHNIMGFLYNAGTAALNAAGDLVTLSGGGTVDPAWNDGSTYWIPTGPRNGNGHYKPSIKIVGVNMPGDPANSFRLNAGWPDDGTRGTTNLLYHVTKWDGRAPGYHKNFWEAKHATRVKISGNIFARSYLGSQANAIALISQRGEDAVCSDYLFENNLIIDCAIAISMTSRPGDGTGQGWNVVSIDGSQGGLITIHTTSNIDIANHNANCEIRNVQGIVPDISGIWPATYINSTTFTIPVTYVSGSATINPSSGVPFGSFTMYKAGTPAVRVAIKNNLILNPGSPQAMLTDSFPNQNVYNIIGINTYPILVATGGTLYNGGNDGALSTTGSWAMDDFNCEHNTIVGPFPGAVIAHAFGAIEYNNNTTANDWQGVRWTFRNNIVRGGTGNYAVFYAPGSTNVGAPSLGSAALNKFTDAARNFLHNIIFSPWNVQAEEAVFSGTDDDKLALLADHTPVGFTSYAGSGKADLANFILTNLYTVGSCSVTNGSPTVNFSGGASLPASTIVKGVPFKGPDGLYYLVQARVSATQLTLQTAYQGATASGAYTLGFRGWSSDGSDPGANITTLAVAIAFAGIGGSGGGSGSTTGALALAGKSSIMGFAVIPQTP